MNKLLKFFLFLCLLWLSSYLTMKYMDVKYTLSEPAIKEATIPLDKIFESGNVDIPAKNFHCEGTKDQKVGTILSSILTSALNDKETRLGYFCDDRAEPSPINCSLIIVCGFFKNPNECSSRTLSFTTDSHKNILPDSFSCKDVP